MTLETSHLTDEQLALLASEVPGSRVREHLESCAECRSRWQQYVALQQALRALPPPRLPRDFALAIQTAIALPRVPWWWRHRFSIRVGTLLAATLLVMLLSSALAFPGSGEWPTGKRAQEQATPNRITAVTITPTLAEAGMGGAAAPVVQSAQETPTLEGSIPSTLARPAEHSPAPTNEVKSQVVQPRDRLMVVLFLGAVTLLSVVTVLGIVLGFLLPLVRDPQRGVHR